MFRSATSAWIHRLGYGIGIPLGAFVMLWIRRKKLREERCQRVYGFLYTSFREEFYFYETAIYARKALLAMAGALLRPYVSPSAPK